MTNIAKKLKKYKLKYNLSDKLKKDIYFNKINDYSIKSLKNNHSVMNGGGIFDDNYLSKILEKHKHLYPDSKALYDNYFEKIDKDGIYLEKQKYNYLFNLIELYEFSTIREPPTKILEKETFIYHVSPYLLEYPNNTINFLSDKIDDLLKYVVPFKIQEIKGRDPIKYTDKKMHEIDNIYVYKYKIINDVTLMHTSIDYTLYNLENYFLNIDENYRREFNMQGYGNNYNIAYWMNQNTNENIKKYNGWYEEPDALLTGIMTEIMMLGDTSKFLEFIEKDTINISDYVRPSSI